MKFDTIMAVLLPIWLVVYLFSFLMVCSGSAWLFVIMSVCWFLCVAIRGD
jgi:hypothetical protein